MKLDLVKMQNKVNKLMAVFTNIVNELDTQIADLGTAIDDNNQQIANCEVLNKEYSAKIDEYEALKNKVQSIIK